MIAVVAPPSRSVNHYRPPLSLMYVADWYRSKGIGVVILDYPMKSVIRDKKFLSDSPRMIAEIKKKMIAELDIFKPKFVSISCYSPELAEVKDLIKSIKYPVIVGGIHPTLHPEDFKGIRVHKGRADVGSAAYDLVDMKYYTSANPYAIRGVFTRPLYVMSGIGCPSSCLFCVASTLRKHFGIDRFKPPASFSQEVKLLAKTYNCDSFYIVDDLFTMDKAYVRSFCSSIKDSLMWGCQAKVSTLTEDMVKLLSEAGCIQLDIGVERGSDKEFKRIKKGQTIRQVKDAFRWCHKHGIRTFANFLVNLEGETKKDLTDIENLIQEIKPTLVSVNVYDHLVGSTLRESTDRKHSEEWAAYINKKYNSIWCNLVWHFRWKYVRSFLRSRRKLNYFEQILVLVREILNQKKGVV